MYPMLVKSLFENMIRNPIFETQFLLKRYFFWNINYIKLDQQSAFKKMQESESACFLL